MLVLRVDDPDDKREIFVRRWDQGQQSPPPNCRLAGSTLLVLTLIHNSVPLPSTSSSASDNKADRTPVLYAIQQVASSEIKFLSGGCAPYQPSRLRTTPYPNINNSTTSQAGHFLHISVPTIIIECCDQWRYNLLDMSRGGTTIASLADSYTINLDGTIALRYDQEVYIIPHDRWHNAKLAPPQVHDRYQIDDSKRTADITKIEVKSTQPTNCDDGHDGGATVAAATSIIPGDGKTLASMKWNLEKFGDIDDVKSRGRLNFLGLHHLIAHQPQKKMVEL
jgi:hypothetical protein